MQDMSWRTQAIKVSDSIGYFIEIISAAFCIFIYAVMIGTAILGITFRYIMHNPFEWTEELARLLMLWLAFLAISIALRKREHIAIQFVVQKLPYRVSKVLEYCVDLLIAFFLIILIKQGYLMTSRTILTTSTLNISMFWPYFAVPLAAFISLLQLILNVTKKILSESGST